MQATHVHFFIPVKLSNPRVPILLTHCPLCSPTAILDFTEAACNSGSNFNGGLDGNGKTISNFTWKKGAVSHAALITYLNTGFVKHLGVENMDLQGTDHIGMLGFAARGSAVLDVFVKGQITANDRAGGIVGALDYNTPIKNLYSIVTITGAHRWSGGISGRTYGSLTNSFTVSSIAVTARQNGGPISGEGGVTTSYFNTNSTCTNCNNTNGAGVDVRGVDPADYFFDKTNAPFTSWDFSSVWLESAADYPAFQP
jgi:hypothetical protein